MANPQPSRHLARQHRAIIRRNKPPCGLCGAPIDYTLPYTDQMSFVVDHVSPWAISHDDSFANKQAAHWRCNRAKSDRTDGGPVIKRSGALTRPQAATD